MKPKKRFFTNHSKSSAMVISLAVHAILAVVALSFVAVTVITKGEQNFEAKQVVRPRMAPKKLQVPVTIKKKQRKPKMRQRIVVKHQVNRSMPDIKMPEISGIKGGLGGAGNAGFGDTSSIGFNMPEINIFGVRSKGEKILFALDTDDYIMRDEVGGKRAYAIIKQELIKVVEELDPTTLFNLVVFDHGGATALFPKLVPATRENVTKLEKWLEPLNAVTKANLGNTGTYGRRTLGKGGKEIQMTAGMNAGLEQGGPYHWYRPAAMAMVDQADTVFILSGWWGSLRKATGSAPDWPKNKKENYYKFLKKAKEDFKEENRRRAAKGEPERIIRDDNLIFAAYYPEQQVKYWRGNPSYYYYTWKDYLEALKLVRKEHAPKLPAKSGFPTNKNDKFSLNVIFFAPEEQAGPVGYYEMLANRCNGDFRVIKGLKAIENSASKGEN